MTKPANPIALLPHEIHIWTIPLVCKADIIQQKTAWLHNDEQMRASQFKFPEHQRRFIAGRAALRDILARYITTAPDKVEFIYLEHKKPALHPTHGSDIQFNLAHSEDIALCAVTSTYQIGVDIEKLGHKNHLAIAERYFSPKEIQSLKRMQGSAQTELFYRLWSRKEALVKAVGKGLSIPLSSFSVSTDDQVETLALEQDTWTVLPILAPDGFAAAAATNQMVNAVRYIEYVFC